MPGGGMAAAAVLLLATVAAGCLGVASACTYAINGVRDCYGFSNEWAKDATAASRRNTPVLCADDEERCAVIRCTPYKRVGEEDEEYKFYGGCRGAIDPLFRINDRPKKKRPTNEHYKMQLGKDEKSGRIVFKRHDGSKGYEVKECEAYVCDTDFCNGATPALRGRGPPLVAATAAAVAAVLAGRVGPY